MENAATNSQAINALPPEAQELATSFAPKPESNDRSPLLDSPEFKVFLNKLFDFATAQSQSPANWERRRKSVQLRKRLMGEYYGFFDKSRGWVNAKTEGDGIYFDSTIQTTIRTLLAQLVKSKPVLKCAARVPNMIDKREAARVAEEILGSGNREIPKRTQREWLTNLICAGHTFRLTYFNPDKEGCGVYEDKFESVEIPGGDEAHFCALCGETSVSDDDKCTGCGNPQVDSFKVQSSTVMARKGSEYKQIGDTDFDVPDALEITCYGETDTISEMLLVKRDRLIPRCVLQDALGVENIPDTDAPDYLNYKQLFDQRSSGSESLAEFKPIHYEELWIAPAVLASYKLPTDYETKGGHIVKAGTAAKEAFPNGAYASRTKKDIQQIYPQGIGECWSDAVNGVGEGFHGQGEWDLNELGEQLTEAKSMKMNSLFMDSFNPLMIREGYVDTENIENKAGLVVPISQDYPLSHDLDNLMTRSPAAGMPTEAYEVSNDLKGEIQQSAGSFSTQSDAPDVKAMGTATGIAAIQSQTMGRRGPALELYAQMLADQAYQRLEQIQKYWCKKMYAGAETELGDDAVKWFMDCNIRRDIVITVVPESWMPQTDEQKRADLQAFLGMTGEIMAAKGDPKMLDEVLRKANEVFGGGMDFNDLESESVEAQLRLDKLRDVGAFLEKQGGPMLYDEMGGVVPEAILLAYAQTAEMLKVVHEPADAMDIFANLPLDVMFDDHDEFTEAYTDWLKTAEGRAASLFIRTLVRQLADYHLQAKAYCAKRLNEYSKIPLIPDLQAQLMAEDAQQKQQLSNMPPEAPQAPPPPPEPPPHPMQKVAESINFKDLPPSGQVQLAALAGLDISHEDMKAHNEAMNPPPETTKEMALGNRAA